MQAWSHHLQCRLHSECLWTCWIGSISGLTLLRVDDECIALVGTTPRVLARAIDTLLEITTTVFRLLHLEINFSKGKPEAILLFRGKQATAMCEQWRTEDGQLAIPLNQYDHIGKVLWTVTYYKHLGTLMDARGVALAMLWSVPSQPWPR